MSHRLHDTTIPWCGNFQLEICKAELSVRLSTYSLLLTSSPVKFLDRRHGDHDKFGAAA